MSFFTIAEIVVSLLIIALILVQERDSGTSGLFGGSGGEGGFYAQRRGLEKIFFVGTIVLIALFAGLALLNLVVA